MRIIKPPTTVGPSWATAKLVRLAICPYDCGTAIFGAVPRGTAYGVDVKRLRNPVGVCQVLLKNYTAVFIWAKDAKGGEGFAPLAVFDLAELYMKGNLVLKGGSFGEGSDQNDTLQ